MFIMKRKIFLGVFDLSSVVLTGASCMRAVTVIKSHAQTITVVALLSLTALTASGAYAQTTETAFERDLISTGNGDLEIVFLGHASLMLEYGGLTVHVDPWSKVADYSKLPKADLLLLTHNHADHLDPEALRYALDEATDIVCPESCADACPGATVLRYGDSATVRGLRIEAAPSYNLTNLKNPGGRLVHPRGLCNGYIVDFGGMRVLFAGETENVPELAGIEDIDICFLAVDGVYNLTPEMAAVTAKVFAPKVLYPIHYADADVALLASLLEGTGIEVRIRDMR